MIGGLLQTLALIIFAVFVLVIPLAGAGIVWHIPVYKRFKVATSRLERANVTRIRGLKLEPPVTLKSIGNRRISEVMESSLGPSDVQLAACFGSMVLKEQAIEDAIVKLRISCGVAAACLLVGVLWIFVGDVAAERALQSASTFEKAGVIFDYLVSHHFILWAEILLGAFAAVTILDGSVLLHRINLLLTQ